MSASPHPAPPRTTSPRRSRTASAWRLALAALLVGGLVVGAPASDALAQPEPRRSAWVRSHSVLQMRSLRTRDGGILHHRASATRVDVTVFAPPPTSGATLSAHFAGTWAFDLGLPGDPVEPRVAERQLEPTLDRAWVRWVPWEPLRIEIGRNDIYSPLGPSRVDGLRVGLTPRRGTTIEAVAGQRNQHEQLQIDSFALAAEGDLDWRADAASRPWLLELRAHHDDRLWALAAGARTERAWRDDVELERIFWAAARAGEVDGWHARVDARLRAVQRLVDRASLALEGPLGHAVRAHASARLERAVFPLDSIFSVFESPPRADLGVGLAGSDDRARSVAWQVESGARWWAEHEDELPGFESGRGRAFARSVVTHRAGPWRTRASTDVEARDRGWDARASLGVHRDLPALRRQTGRPFAQLAATGAAGSDERRAPEPDRRAVATFLGVGLPATDWATVHVHGAWTWDLRNGHGARALAVFDLRLPGGPR